MPCLPDQTWPDELFELAIKLWNEGHSASLIGLKIGKTRNAVIGKLNRMKKKGNPQPPRATTQAIPRRNARPPLQKKKVIAFVPKEQASLPQDQKARIGTLTLFELQPYSCRWPFGDRDFTFCGDTKISGSPYCAEHTRLSRKGSWAA